MLFRRVCFSLAQDWIDTCGTMSSTFHRIYLLACLVIISSFTGFRLCAAAPKRGSRKQRLAASSDEDVGPVAEPSSPDLPRRGGLRRRLREAKAQSASPERPAHTPLNDNLKRRWGTGELSSATVQSLAHDAATQGTPGIDNIAASGTYGAHPQNLFRDLLKLFGSPVGAPMIDWIEIPLKSGRKISHPFILPHRFFQSLAHDRPDLWRQRVVGSTGAARQFWESMRETPFVKNHPHLPEEAWATTIPIGMHGDGGAFNKHDGLFTFNWNSLLATGTTCQTRFVFTVVRKSEMVADTMDAIMRLFGWSCNIMLSGETPLLDYLNRPALGKPVPLAHGYRACLVQCRGDWEFYTQLFYFPRWDGADRCCWLCRASSTNPDRSWTDFNPNAGWRDTIWTHEEWINYLRASGYAIPVLFLVVLGFRLECISIDVLHAVDQGFSTHIVANTIWVIAVIRNCFGGATYAERIRRCGEHLKKWYSDTRCKYKLAGKLTVERVKLAGDWPKLRAKAAHTRYLARYALYLVQTFGHLESLDDFARLHDNLALGVCQLLVEFYELLDTNSMFVTDQAKVSFARIGNQMPAMYSRLSRMCFEQGMRLWKLSPKMHLFVHLCCEQLIMGNPRYFWTYSDEDLVRIMVGVAESVHPRTLPISVLSKWLWCVYDQLLVDPDIDLWAQE